MIKLRDFENADKPRIIDILNTPEVTRFLTSRIPSPYTAEDASWWLSVGCQQGVIKAIELNGNLVGCIGIEPGENEYAYTGEVGYWLAKDVWGNGIATRALKTILAQLPGKRFTRLQATVFEGNVASEGVLKKCGFKQEGSLTKALHKNGVFYNAVLYGKVIS